MSLPTNNDTPRQGYTLAAPTTDGRLVVLLEATHHNLHDEDEDERTVLGSHNNDLGDWCPHSGATVAAGAGCDAHRDQAQMNEAADPGDLNDDEQRDPYLLAIHRHGDDSAPLWEP